MSNGYKPGANEFPETEYEKRYEKRGDIESVQECQTDTSPEPMGFQKLSMKSVEMKWVKMKCGNEMGENEMENVEMKWVKMKCGNEMGENEKENVYVYICVQKCQTDTSPEPMGFQKLNMKTWIYRKCI